MVVSIIFLVSDNCAVSCFRGPAKLLDLSSTTHLVDKRDETAAPTLAFTSTVSRSLLGGWLY